MPTVVVLYLSLLGAPVSKPLAIAYRDGDIALHCGSFAGHTIALLKLENLRGNELLVDVSGSYLVPVDEGVQRLALALLKAGSPNTTVRLPADGQTQVKVLCVWMDASKASPSPVHEYRLARRLAPRRVLAILRDWKSRPDTPQTAVQAAVWGHVPSIKTLPKAAGFTATDFQTTRKYALHDGNLFALTADGNLFRDATDAPLSFRESKCVDILSDGRLFAIRNIPCRRSKSTLETVVSALDSDTGAWADLFESEPGALLWVDRGANSAIVQTSEGAVVRVGASRKEPLLQQPRSISVGPQGDVFWIPRDSPSFLLTLDPKGKRTTVYRHEEPLLTVISPEEFLYVLDCRGNLLSFEKGKVRQIRNDVLAIEPLNGRWLVKTKARHRGHEQIPGKVFLCSGRTPIVGFSHPVHLPQHYLCQAPSDVVFSIDGGLSLRRYDDVQQTWEPVRRLAR